MNNKPMIDRRYVQLLLALDGAMLEIEKLKKQLLEERESSPLPTYYARNIQ